MLAVLSTFAIVAATAVIATPRAASAADPCNPVVNKIACENTKTGSPSSTWDVGNDGDPSILGFATQMSVNVGQTEQFKVKTTASSYGIQIFRFGYYQGNGARLVATVSPSAPQSQPNCITSGTTGEVDCGNWSVSASWAVPSDAVSGVYEALLTSNTGKTSAVIFVVRDDSSHSDVLFQTDDATWQAYNTYGGNSFYTGTGPSYAGAAQKLSYNRPLLGRTQQANENNFFAAEYPMIRFMERNGYDMSYFSNLDTDVRGSLITNHKTFMSVGHDEYWSANMRANVTAARDAGTNLLFESGNAMFWKTRYEPSIDGSSTANRTLVCYKETHFNIPASQVDSTGQWTGTWQDPRWASPPDGGWPENQVMGTMSAANGLRLDSIKVPATYKNLRIWRNTAIANLAAGATYTMPAGTLGYEWDTDYDNGFRPGGLIDLSAATITQTQTDINNGNGGYFVEYGHTVAPGTMTHSMTYYRAPSGAQVFSVGSVQWAWGLDANHDAPGTPIDVNMQQAQVNILADMGAQPATLMSGLTLTTPTTDSTPATATINSPANGATVNTGQPVVISGTAADTGGGKVAGVEVSTDGNSWHKATPGSDWTTWSYTWTPTVLGAATIRVRAIDDSGNLPTATTRNVTVAYQCPCSLFPASTTPAAANSGDAQAINVGMKFTADVGGTVTGVRFYKGSSNTGTHVGSLWTSAGVQLAQATFSGESASGWQQVSFSTPVTITANTTYVVSYFAPRGNYSVDESFFSNAGYDVAPLHAPKTAAVSGGNGVYAYSGATAFPNQTFSAENYWVDLVFQGSGTDTTPPTVSATTPASGATGVATSAAPTASFSEAVQSASIGFSLKAGATTIAGTTTYNSSTNTATFTPSAALAASTTYTATVSGVKDTAGNTIAAPYTWSFTTGAPDTTPPTVASTSPTSGATGVSIGANPSATFSEPVQSATIGYTLTAGGVPVAGTTVYDSPSNTVTFVPSANLAPTTTFTATVSGVKDTAGNTIAAPYTWSFTTAAGPTCPCSIWSAGATPSIAADPETAPVELGVKFRTDVAGTISGIRFYKSTTNTGTHIGNLWSSTGTKLATATFSGESGSGWQQVNFATPVAVAANTTYVASYFAPAAHYSIDNSYFTAGGVDNGPLHALASGVDGSNGVYTYGSTSSFPTSSFQDTNYWVDVVFNTTPVSDTTPPTLTGSTPANGATGVAPSVAPTATFSEPVQSATVGFTLKAGATTIAGTTAYNSATNTATFTPTAALTGGTTYTATISGVKDTAGNTIAAPYTWSFTTTVPDTTPPTVTAATPASGATGVSIGITPTATFSEPVQAATVGFSLAAGATAVPGTSAYNSATNTATFTPTAALAGATTYTATISGVKDTAGNTIAAPYTWSFTTAAVDTTPPTVTGTAPVNGATNVATTTAPTATFSEPVQSATIVFGLKAGATTIAGTTAYNSATNTATFTPSAALTASTTYTATVSGVKDTAGNTIAAPATWSFTTAAPSCPCSIWSAGATPAVQADSDTGSVELGVKFRSDVAGTVTGVRFYKGTTNTGTHVGNLWSSTGTKLASATFTGESASGWQQVNFATPVAIAANTTYVVSYLAPVGRYSTSNSFFATAGVDNAPLHALATGVDGSNGVYAYGSTSTFPSSSFQNTNYWVDVVFTSTPPADTTPPTVGAVNPANGATSVATSVAPTATFSEAVQSATIGFTLKAGATTIAGTTAYNSATNTATFTPSAALAAGTTYTGTISGVKDTAGNTIAAPFTWTFTTAAPDTTPPTVTAATPANGATGVATTVAPTATFSEAVQPATISYALLKSDSTSVSGTVAYNAATNVATFTPNTALAGSATYTATISGVKDTAGNTIAAPFSSTFTTAASDTTPPTFSGVTATGITSTGATIGWTTNEASTSQVDYGLTTAYGSSTSADAGLVTTHSQILAGLAANTTYHYRVRSADASGNTAVSGDFTFTTTAASSGVTIDTTVFKDGAGTQTTAPFSTTAANGLLVAFVSSDGPFSAQTSTVSGGGLTWTLVARSNTQFGTSEIWSAPAPAVLTNATVTSTLGSGGYDQSLTVVAFKGATGIGASNVANAASGGPSISLTTTRAKSWVFGVGNDWDGAGARTVPSGQTMVHQFVDTAAGDTFWTQSTTAATPNAGTVVTLNDTAPTADRWNFAAIEILGS